MNGKKSLTGAILIVSGVLVGGLLRVIMPDSPLGTDAASALVLAGISVLGFGIAHKIEKLTAEVKGPNDG